MTYCATRIRKLPGNASLTLKATVTMLAARDDTAWARPPINIEFQVSSEVHSAPHDSCSLMQVPMFTASGLHVRLLKVLERSNYQTIKWVRYITRSGEYEIRTSQDDVTQLKQVLARGETQMKSIQGEFNART